MQKPLTTSDIDEKIGAKLYFQKYSPKEIINGVKIVDLENHIDEESDFSEVIKINSSGFVSEFPGFILKQINRTKLYPGSVKAWHIHLKQDELWYVLPSGTLLVGLWDIRKNSKTSGKTMRIILGGGFSKLLYIPKGVAHGSANLIDREATMLYFVNEVFNPNNPDEGRINWNALGDDFWHPQRD